MQIFGERLRILRESIKLLQQKIVDSVQLHTLIFRT